MAHGNDRNSSGDPLTDRELAWIELVRSGLSGVSAHVALVEASGTIRAVNHAWREFADANGLSLPEHGLGANYLDVCDRAIGREVPSARAAARGMRAVASGETPMFELDYDRSSPTEERSFVMRVTPLASDKEAWLLVAHEPVWDQRRAADALSRLGTERARELEGAMARLREEETGRDAAEARYRSVVTAMAEGVVIQNAEGQIVDCNPSSERILGLTADQIVGRTPMDPRWQSIRRDGTPFPGHEHPAMVTLRTGEPQLEVMMGLRKPTGSLAWIRINSEPLFEEMKTRPSGVVATFSDITERIAAEEELKEITKHRIDGEEKERVRVARDLHDSVSQLVASVRFRVRAMLEGDALPRGQAVSALRKTDALLGQALDEIRRIASNLRPSLLDEHDLTAAVRRLGHEYSERSGKTLKLTNGPTPATLPWETQVHLYRIVQEALGNIEHHAGAERVEIDLFRDGSVLVLRVADDGRGFDRDGREWRAKRHWGLKDMEDRARLIGASFTIESSKDGGTEIRVHVPLTSSEGAP